MSKIRIVKADGSSMELSGEDGKSVMQVAVGAGVPGIVGECGGSSMCATCHVYVEEPWLEKLQAPDSTELEMLDCTASERLHNSRLSCQIKLSPALDGLSIRLPDRQQ